MLDVIKKLLKKNCKISAWVINEINQSTMELFFIKDKLDMNRETDVHAFDVKVYVDFTEDNIKYRGLSSFEVGISDAEEEIVQKIDKAIYAAGFIKNKWYDLPEKDESVPLKVEAFDDISDLKHNIHALRDALFDTEGFSARVNSCEVFAHSGCKRVVTSKEVDVVYPINKFSFELVTDHHGITEPVEIFSIYSMPKIDLKRIRKIVERQLKETEGRASARRNSTLKDFKVILSGESVEEFFYFYFEQASAAMVFQKISRAKLGEAFQGENPISPITMTLNPALMSSIGASPVDGEGKVLKAYPLYKDGVLVNYKSDAKFSHYLGSENLGSVSTFEIAPGQHSAEVLMQGSYIEILQWSSFLVDSTTGDFGGEFRLAKLVMDGKTEYVTGGSLSSNIFAVQNSMQLSSELETRTYSIAPKFIAIDGQLIAGE